MRLLAPPAARAFALTWLLLGAVHAMGRFALMAAATTIDLRLPSFFELAMLPPLQAAVLLWLLRRFDAAAFRAAASTALRHAGARRALLAGGLAAIVVAVARLVGLPGGTVRHDSRLAFGGFLLCAAVVAGLRIGRSTVRGERVDWALATAFFSIVGSNALLGWLDAVAVRSLPQGVGAPAATGELTALGIVAATILALRLERRAGEVGRSLLWTALAVFLGCTAVHLMVLLIGWAIEPWTSLWLALRLAAGALALGALLLPTSAPRTPEKSVSAASPSRLLAPRGAWWRIWAALSLTHVALSVTMTLVLFDTWLVDATRLASWLILPGVQTAILVATGSLATPRPATPLSTDSR